MKFLKVAWRDISSIFKNRFIRVSVAAIIVVPLLYSLLYLYAFWDPYAKLSALPVAVVNLDKGSTSDGKDVNYGKDLVDKLKDNNKIGWKFVSLEEAQRGVKGKGYYAMFVVPDNFSEKVLSAKTGKPQQPALLFTSNDKKNFIASQINGKVEVELKSEIIKNITEEYTKVTFNNLYDLKDGLQKASDGSNDLNDGLVKARDGSKDLKDGVGKLKDNIPQMKDGVQKLYDGSTALSNGLGAANSGAIQLRDGVGTLKSKVDAGTAFLDAHPDMKALINKDTINSTKSILNDAMVLKDADTSILNLVPVVTAPNTMTLVNKTVADFNKIDVNAIMNDPLFKGLGTMLTPQNMQNVGKLIQDTDALSKLDMTKLQPVMGLLNSAPQLGSLMQQAQQLGNIDTTKLAAIQPLLDTNNAAKITGLLSNVATMPTMIDKQESSIDQFTAAAKQLSDLKAKVDAMPDSPQKTAATAQLISGYNKLIATTASTMPQTKTQLDALKTQLVASAPLVTAVQGALTTSNLNSINTMLTQLQTMQANFKKPETQAVIAGVQTALSPANVAYMQGVLPQLMGMKSDLDKNAQNLAAVKSLLQKANDPATMQTIAKIQTLQGDITQAAPLVAKIKGSLTPAQMAKLQQSPQLVGELLTMQKDLQNNSKLLEVAQSSLTDGNVKMAQDLISAMPQLTDGINKLASGSSALADGTQKLQDGSNELKDGLGTLNGKIPELADGTQKLYDGTTDLNDGMVKLADGSKELHDKLKEGSDKINKNLVNTSDDMGKYVSEPLTVDEKPINAVKNYGTGFAPYFIPLSLWVGALMMFFVITDEVDNDLKVGSASIVAGKFLSYGFIGLLQALLVSIVVLMLGLKPDNVLLYFAFNIFMSYVFISIIQCMIFLMGQAGRLMSIILLILQLTACAGTFPLEVVPRFFKVLNPFMPFTYAVSGLREIIAGIDYSVLGKDVVVLACAMFAFLFISILMKGHADKVQEVIKQKKEEAMTA